MAGLNVVFELNSVFRGYRDARRDLQLRVCNGYVEELRVVAQIDRDLGNDGDKESEGRVNGYFEAGEREDVATARYANTGSHCKENGRAKEGRRLSKAGDFAIR